MECPKCRTVNPDDSKFCKECATRLGLADQPSFTQTLETTTDELARGTVFAGRYEIIEELGAGGMGRVYRAQDTKLNEEVALKLIKPEIAAERRVVERFRNELKTARKITHKNVCRMYDFHEKGKTLYLTMEYVRGEDLKSLIHRMKALTIGAAVSVAHQVADGLAEAHKLGIVHRDLKPGNIMIDKDGQAKIMDFGIARVRQEKGITGEGAVIGTPEYMSPEQVEGKEADQRADIYSLGIILFEMVTGRLPFEGNTPFSIANKQKSEPPPIPKKLVPQIPEGLNKLILRCLEKDRSKRYQTAEELAADLSSIEQSPPLTERVLAQAKTKTKTPHEFTVKFNLRRVWVPALVVLVLAVAAVLTVFLGKPPSQVKSSAPGTTASAVPSLLVLPCQVLGSPESAYLTDAVPSTLSTLLAEVQGIDMKVPPTSFEAEKVHGDLARLAELYGASSCIVTSITTSAGRFTLNVELVDAATRKVRWGKQYEGSRETYNDLVRQAAEGIRLAVKPAATLAPLPSSRVSSEAELALREGEYFLNRYINLGQPPDFNLALTAFNRALKEDPSLAVAAGEIAILYVDKFQNEGEAKSRGALQDAKAWARRALEIDGRCGQAWSALSWIETAAAKADYERTLEYALKAALFSPRDATAHMTLSNSMPTVSLSLAVSKVMVNLDPFFLPGIGNLIFFLSELGRPEEALPFADRLLRIEPESWVVPDVRGYMLLKLGRLKDAREEMARWESKFFENPDSFISQLWGQVRFELAAAERDTATIKKLERHILPPLLDGRAAEDMTLGNGILYICPALAALGRTDEAIRILLKGVETGNLPSYDYLLYDPGLRLLRGDFRFVKIQAASRDCAAKGARVLDDARKRGELPRYLETPLDELKKLLNEDGARGR